MVAIVIVVKRVFTTLIFIYQLGQMRTFLRLRNDHSLIVERLSQHCKAEIQSNAQQILLNLVTSPSLGPVVSVPLLPPSHPPPF